MTAGLPTGRGPNRSAAVAVAGLMLLLVLPVMVWLIGPQAMMDRLVPACVDGRGKSDVKNCLPRPPFVDDESRDLSRYRIVVEGSDQPIDGRVRTTLSDRDVDAEAGAENSDRFLQFIANRYYFGTAVVVLFAASLIAALAAIHMIATAPTFTGRRLPWLAIVGVVGAIAFTEGYYQVLLGLSDVGSMVVGDPLSAVAKRLHPDWAALSGSVETETALECEYLAKTALEVRHTVWAGFCKAVETIASDRRLVTGVTLLSFFLLIGALGMAAFLAPASPEALKAARARMDLILTISAIVLAIFVVYMRQYLQLAEPFIETTASAKALRDGLLVYWAASASLLLAIVFIAAFFVHHLRAQRLASPEGEGGTDAALMKAAGAERSPMEMLQALLKVLLPLISGLGITVSDLITL